MSSSTEIRALEFSTLKVPYEVLNKKFRIAQKTIDREVARVNESSGEVEAVLKRTVVPVGEMEGAVNSLIEKLRGLKRKASDAVVDETEAAAALKRRIDHLKIYVDNNSSPATLQQWRQKRIERYIVEYLLKAGYYESACKFATRSGIDYLTNLSLFASAKAVEESLLRHELCKCLEWCYENRSKLRRLKSTLELRVREQEFIELIRRQQMGEAIKYARKYFNSVDVDQWKTLVRTMGLLAYGADTNLQQYRDLLSLKRFDELVAAFRQENYRLYQLNAQSTFSACLQCGLASMKTPRCFSTAKPWDCGRRPRPECPVCVTEAKSLAVGLPYAHAGHSRLICAHSGEPLNEHNPAYVLPNGMVYGQRSLQTLASDNNGKIVCPRTNQSFALEEAERVYVM